IMDELGFYTELGSRPDPRGLPGALSRVGWRRVDFRPSERAVRFRLAGMALGFGGIGKGYALDRAAAFLRGRGVTRAEIDLGRSYLLIGSQPGRSDGRCGLGISVPDAEA